MESQQLGWGLVGPGRIAATQIAPAIAAAPNGTLISVVSRDLGRATEFAKAHGAAQALDSYPAMLADPAVQALYVWASGPEPHGPYEYPEGCVVFASFRGLSAQHRYNGSPAGEI